MEPLSESDDKYVKGWSWGAFLGPSVFLFVNKKYKLAWKVLVVFVVLMLLQYLPLLSPTAFSDLGIYSSFIKIIYLGLTIWLGIRGREMAWKNGIFSSVSEMKLKQKLVAKINVLVILVTIVGSVLLMFSLVKNSPYVKNPELYDQQAMQMSLADAKTRHSVVDNEFIQGYQKGMIDGGNMVQVTPYTATNSSELGYQYGYVGGCIKASNDPVKTANDESCVKKIVNP